jgi:hypothetical protein
MTTAGDPTGPQGGHAVVATYDGMKAARRAIGKLEEHGVEAANIRLLGELAEKAAHATRTTRRDTRLASYAARSMAGGFTLGGMVGALIGAAIGYLGFSLAGMGLVGAAAAGSLCGAFLGFVLGAMLRMKHSEAWELTYQPVGHGRVSVGVRARDLAQADEAERTLRHSSPLELGRYDYQGAWKTWEFRGGDGGPGASTRMDAETLLKTPSPPEGAPVSAPREASDDQGPSPGQASAQIERSPEQEPEQGPSESRADRRRSTRPRRGSTGPRARRTW